MTILQVGCGLRLDVVKRYDRPGYYVDLGRKNLPLNAQRKHLFDVKIIRTNAGSPNFSIHQPVPAQFPRTIMPTAGSEICKIMPKPMDYKVAIQHMSKAKNFIERQGSFEQSALQQSDEPYIVPYFTLVFGIGGLVAVAGAYTVLGISGVGLLVLLVLSVALVLASLTVLLIKQLRFDPLKTNKRSGGYWGQLLNVVIIAAGWLSIFLVLYYVGAFAAAMLGFEDWFE